VDPRRRLAVEDRLDPLLAGATVGRLVLIPPLVVVVLGGQQLMAALLLAVFILADIYDGVLGRRRGTDGPGRRALDSLVDRLSVHTVYIAAAVGGLLPLWLLVPMLLRDAYCAAICRRMMRSRWVAVRADWMYKVLNLSLATWIVVSPTVGSLARDLGLLSILGWSAIVAIDLRHAVRQVLATPGLRNVVICAGDLRASRREGFKRL
jgi:phosphatidylglycerophosphate synthase